MENALTVLAISSGNQSGLIFPIEGQQAQANKKTVLVFHRYGDRYFLAAIKRAGKGGYELPATKLEEELRAQNVAEHELTLLAFAQ